MEQTTMGELELQAGRVLMVGFSGPSLGSEQRRALGEIAPAGAILFRRNLETPEELLELLADLHEHLPAPRLLALDQEGGRVSRLEPWIGPTPPAAELARGGGQAAFRFGRATGSGLRALGFNVDFAPVVDLCPPEAPNGIGDRSFGTTATVVAQVAGSFLDGLQQAGVAGCLKHFPGLGDTDVDSHKVLPRITRDLRRLEEEDLLPYRLLGARAAAVMVGHGHYAALDPQPGLPATLSTTIVEGLLRQRLGFRGVVVSDDLEMGAVAPLDDDGRAAVAAVAAGCDLILYCSDLDRARRAHLALVEAAESDPAFAARLDAAALAVTRTAARWPAPRPDLEAWKEARQRIFEASRIA
jgi:beta-N-acetylhexosaminidase